MIRVLFVCLGNICRSPMAEAVFARKIQLAGLSEQIEVDSAEPGTGTSARARTPEPAANSNSQESLLGKSRVIDTDDLTNFDYILVMDHMNCGMSSPWESHGNVKLFLEYAPAVAALDVPDPYYTAVRRSLQLIDQAADGLLGAIRKAHQI